MFDISTTNFTYVIIAAVIIVILMIVLAPDSQEGFDPDSHLVSEHDSWDQLSVGRKALDCYSLSNRDCMKYQNCGLCLKHGKMSCIPGDAKGPLFKQDCEQWKHTGYYDRYIFGEKVLTVSPPWSKVYPEYETVYPSRQSIQTLQ